MNLVNHTPFPALAFEGVDQLARPFHVVVLRQTLSFAAGELEYADVQAPLCEADVCFDPDTGGSVRYESDLCPYKPKCDVIVNASVYAPNGVPAPLVPVRLNVRRPDTPAPLPRRPQGSNQFMPPDAEQLRRWKADVALAERSPVLGKSLVDKILRATGERRFQKKRWPVRLLQWFVKWSTLTLLRPVPWKLTWPQAFIAMPLRDEYAFGGQCRINAGDKVARRVPSKRRLTPEQLAGYPDRNGTPERRPTAHAVFECNPFGRGFAQDWALRVTRSKSVPAPRLERLDETVTAKLFWRWQRTFRKSKPATEREVAMRVPAGLGIRGKSHPARTALLGTVDDAFVQGEACLPADFDFAYYNAAPLDQQTDYLQGDEVIELTNLCPPGTPGLAPGAGGNVVMRLSLPKHECFALVRLRNGHMSSLPMNIDTVLIEPTERTLTLVWRLVLEKDQAAPIRVCEMRMRTHEGRGRLQTELDGVARLTANAGVAL